MPASFFVARHILSFRLLLGCGGNGNNFATKKLCENRCSSHGTSMSPRMNQNTEEDGTCNLPVETGPCKAMKPKYYFNSQTRKCERFIYGGCRGNANNFDSFRECVTTCAGQVSMTKTALKAGFKMAHMTKPATEKCVFNKNKFNLGDVLRLSEDSCTRCECSTPPSLTCQVETCPNIKLVGNTEGCSIYKPVGTTCCSNAYVCQEPNGGCPSNCPPIEAAHDLPGYECQKFDDTCGCTRGFVCIQVL